MSGETERFDEWPQSNGFDRWCHSAVDPRFRMEDGKPLPVLTVVLYRVCGNDPAKFEEAVCALRAAFEAGASEARMGDE